MEPTNGASLDLEPSTGAIATQQDPRRSSPAGGGTERQLDRVRTAVRNSNLPDLDWSTILGAYHEEGIRSLEDLAKKLEGIFRDPSSSPQAVDISVLSQRTPKNVSEAIVHKVPKYPLLRDGVVYDPRDIVRFNGQELLYIVDGTFGSNILIVDDPETIRTILAVRIFSGYADRSSNIRDAAESKAVPPSVPPLRPETIPPPPFKQYPYPDPSTPELRLFSQKNYGGARLTVAAGYQWRDLTKTYIFLPFDDWNDEINSMYPTSSTAIFKEHIYFFGSFLILPRYTYISIFGDYGWDARVSSLANYG